MMQHAARITALFGMAVLFGLFNAHADELYPTEIAGKLDQSHNFECVGSYGETVENFAVHGNYVYLGQGYTLRVLDIADPARPKEVGWLRVAGRIHDMIVNGPALYLTTGQEGRGLKVINISDPAHPRLHKTYDENNMGLTACGMGNYVFIDEAGKYGDEWGVYRISDPLNPVKVAKGSHGTNRNPFCTDGDRFYQAVVRELPDQEFLVTLRDLTSSATTIRECKISYSSGLFQGSRTFLNDFDAASNTLSAYSNTVLSLPFSGKSRELFKLVETDDGFMEIKKTVSIGKWRLTKDDQYRLAPANDPGKCLLETKIEPALVGNVLFAVKGDRVKIFDLSGDRLVECGAFPDLSGEGAIQFDDSLAVVADEQGLNFFNVSNPRKPTPVGNYRFHGGVKRVEVAGNRACLINVEDKLEILDVSDPIRPRPIPNDHLTTGSVFASADAKEIHAVDRDSSLTMICRLTETSIDIMEKSAAGLVLRGQIKRAVDEEDDADYGILMLGTTLYYIKINHIPFPFVWPSFDVYDISNPAAPKLAGHEARNPEDASDGSDWCFGPPAPAMLPPDPAAKYRGWYLCLPHSHRTTGHSARGVMIYDCSNPLHPRLAGFYDRLSVTAPVSLQKDKIVIADREGGLIILRHAK